MSRCGNVGGRGAFAEHLLDRISGDKVNEEEDEADHQPDHRQGVEDALEKSSQFSVLRDCSPVGRLNAVGIHTHHDWI